MKKSIRSGSRCQVPGASKTFFLAWMTLMVISAGACAETPVKKDAAKDAKKSLSVADVSKKVEEAQGKAEDVQMELQMEMKDSLSGQQQKMKGKVQMKSPDKIFVRYTEPTEQLLYIGKHLVQMYQPSEKTVYQQRPEKGASSEPIYLGVGKQLKKYIDISKVTIFKDSGDEVGLLFIPKDKMSAGFDKMKVSIKKKDWWPFQMEMETPSMNTKVRFSNYSFNKGLKDEVFQFTPPKDAQVVDGTVF